MPALLLPTGRRHGGSVCCHIGSGVNVYALSRMTLRLICLLLVFVDFSWQQKDPLNDFCRRFGHQSTVIDQTLYLDGGLLDWNPISQNPQNYTNTWELYYDLNTSPANVGMPQLYANLSKNGSIPDLTGGVLWPDAVNKRFYLFGGDYYDITPNQFSLLSYDVLYNQWESFGVPSTPINSVSWGAGIGISELGKGYMLGGWLSNSSVPGWSGGPLATSTLIMYDMDSQVWTNNTGPDNTPRAEGVMVYIPASNSGLLIYFGGITAPYDNETVVGVPMSKIYIYDIASSNWYNQTAVGEVPDMRRRFCAGATWAPDQSSYNIYLYGGAGIGPNTTGFDDVYILTLPSFTWIKWWPTSPGVGNPHHSLTCNVIDGAQMLIIGGTFPLSENCDSPLTWGTHNLDLGQQNPAQAMWYDYQLNITSYIVPTGIISVVGGSSLGGATATAPAAGYDDRDLAVYFTQTATIASRTPTRFIPTASSTNTSGPSEVLSTGAIAGIAVGGAVVIIAVIIATCCLIRRHRRKKQLPQNQPTQNQPTQNPDPGPNTGPHYQQHYPRSPRSPYDQEFHDMQYETLPSHHVISVAELPVTTYPYPINMDPKYDTDIHETQQIPIPTTYGDWQPTTPPLQQYPSPTSSPHPSSFSARATRSELSGTNPMSPPTPTYASSGRLSARRSVPLSSDPRHSPSL